jgi:hypothetical protein
MTSNSNGATPSLHNQQPRGHAAKHGQIVGLLVFLTVGAGCFPPPMGEGEESTDSETGECEPATLDCPCADVDLDGDGIVSPGGECNLGLECVEGVCGEGGDGDGDPGDGDGDPNCEAPTVMCEGSECWASDPSWTAEANAATAETIAAALDAGVWLPADLDVGDECWSLLGSDQHACIVDVCGEHLLGQPASEIPLVPDIACDFIGAWESTAMAYDLCFGVTEGVAVELRDASEPFHAGDMWGACPTINGIPTLCNSESIACVPADFSEANICLPLNGCPSLLPEFGIEFETGWGGACYPRCAVDEDCGAGMVCAASIADGSRLCAWPR